jgi:hypothetical protein
MAMTRLGRNLAIIVVLAVVGGGGYYAAKQTGILDKKVQQQTVDIQPAPPSPQVAQPVVVQPAEQQEAPQVVQQAPSSDASANRGMQFLLNQGKQQ